MLVVIGDVSIIYTLQASVVVVSISNKNSHSHCIILSTKKIYNWIEKEEMLRA